MKLNLEGKVALVTGGGRGMGEATCIGLAEEGVKIAALDIGGEKGSGVSTSEDLEETVNKIKESGGEAIPVYADLTKENQVESAVNQTVKEFGKIHILVNCVGYAGHGLVKDFPFDEWKKTYDINIHALFLACKYTIPQLIKQNWGRIINISSLLGMRANYNQSAYASSKFAVIGLTQSLANELGEYNITANSVCPTATAGPFLDEQAIKLNMTPEEFRNNCMSRNIIEKMVYPEDVANAIIFLCSDRAKFITGSAICVDGGALVKNK